MKYLIYFPGYNSIQWQYTGHQVRLSRYFSRNCTFAALVNSMTFFCLKPVFVCVSTHARPLQATRDVQRTMTLLLANDQLAMHPLANSLPHLDSFLNRNTTICLPMRNVKGHIDLLRTIERRDALK